MAMLASCTGAIGPGHNGHAANTPGAGGNPGSGGGPSPVDPSTPPADCEAPAIALDSSRLLTKPEIVNTIQAAFAPVAIEPTAVQDIPEDAVETGYPNNVGATVSSSLHQSKLIELAESVADKVSASFSSMGIACSTDKECLEKLLAKSGRIALKRRLSAAETTRYVDAAPQVGTSSAEKIRYAVVLLLLSADFAYELRRPNVSDATAKKDFARYQMAVLPSTSPK
jgi:hypothetical protein